LGRLSRRPLFLRANICRREFCSCHYDLWIDEFTYKGEGRILSFPFGGLKGWYRVFKTFTGCPAVFVSTGKL
jgi:hypothetical protein